MNIEKRNEKIRKQSKDDDIKNIKTGKLKWERIKVDLKWVKLNKVLMNRVNR